LLLQKGLNSRVELFANILNQYRVTLANCSLKELQVLFFSELHNLYALLLAKSSDPFVSLALRVDKKWPSLGLLGNNSVFNGKSVTWKTLDGPISDLDWISQHVRKTKLARVRDLFLFTSFDPLCGQLIPKH
jgi:hypothetical protein